MNQNFQEGEHTFLLEGPAGNLEIHTSTPKTGIGLKSAIICHPHPVHGGTMNNKVVSTLAKAFLNLGLNVVRFNFRGVGQSEGHFDHAVGEIDDLRAVYAWLHQCRPSDPIWLAGFSFGSYIAYSLTAEGVSEQLITIAPAVNHHDFLKHTIETPWLLIQPEMDEIIPPEQVYDFVSKSSSTLDLIRVSEASHFFHGKLVELRDLIEVELAEKV